MDSSIQYHFVAVEALFTLAWDIPSFLAMSASLETKQFIVNDFTLAHSHII